MEKKQILDTIKTLRENSKPRKFKQSVDLVVNLKDVNLKNPVYQLDLFVQLHYSKGKGSKVCALVGPELETDAKEVCDKVILAHEFESYAKDKKKIKKLANEFDFFIAQANIMPKVAQTFGKVLGPRGKMPNPKAGCVIPPKFNVKALYDKLQNTIRIKAKDRPIVQTVVGKEDMKDEEIADNIMVAYHQIVSHLPKEQHNIKNAFVKLTMGKPVKLGN